MLGCKASFNKYQSTGIIQIKCLDHYTIKLEVNYKKKTKDVKSTLLGKVGNIFLFRSEIRSPKTEKKNLASKDIENVILSPLDLFAQQLTSRNLKALSPEKSDLS